MVPLNSITERDSRPLVSVVKSAPRDVIAILIASFNQRPILVNIRLVLRIPRQLEVYTADATVRRGCSAESHSSSYVQGRPVAEQSQDRLSENHKSTMLA